MYNALNEAVMFQGMRDRTDRMQGLAGADSASRHRRGWWRRKAVVAR